MEQAPSEWQFAGYRHTNNSDRLLARTAAKRNAEMRRVARYQSADWYEDLS